MTTLLQAPRELAPRSAPRLAETPAPRAQVEGRVVLEGIRWQTYQALLEDLGDRPIHLTFDRGRLEIMTLSVSHESYKSLLGRILETVTLELNIPIRSVGSHTLAREDLQRGIEPDESYYILNESKVRGKVLINLDLDPPPDLGMEIDISRSSVSRQQVYAALRIPELWRFDGETLFVYLLNPQGEYVLSDKSLNLPFLPMKEIGQFLQLSTQIDETSLMRSLLAWVREHLGAYRRETSSEPN
jgi:Uma2 family endonuclease